MRGLVSARTGMFALAAVAALGGICACSTLSPQVFAERYSGGACGLPNPQAGCPAPPPSPIPLPTAIDEAESVRARYLKAYRELSEVGAGSSAMVIVLSALGLYKGVTHPDAKGLAAIGTAGSLAYVWGTAMTSKPRQQAFSAGAQSLGCALSAARAYEMPPGWFDAASGSDAGESLAGLAAHARRQVAALTSQELILLPLRDIPPSIEIETLSKTSSGTCVAAGPSPCVPPDGAAGAYASNWLSLCQRNHPVCVPRGKVDVQFVPDPRIDSTLARLTALRAHLEKLARTADEQAMVAGKAGDTLWERTVQIQVTVADQVLKAEPDLDKVRALAQGMRATAFSLTAAPAFAPASSAPASATADGTAAKAQAGVSKSGSKAASPRRVVIVADAEIAQARHTIAEATLVDQRLSDKLAALRASVSNASHALTACTDNAPAGSLSVIPVDTEIELAPGATASFTVSDGTGSPGANFTPKSGTLERHDSANSTVFDYTADPAATEGSLIKLSFIDKKSPPRDVTITIVGSAASAPSTSTSTTAELTPDLQKQLAPALGLDPTVQNLLPQELVKIEACMKNKLGRKTADGHQLDVQTVLAIQAGNCK